MTRGRRPADGGLFAVAPPASPRRRVDPGVYVCTNCWYPAGDTPISAHNGVDIFCSNACQDVWVATHLRHRQVSGLRWRCGHCNADITAARQYEPRTREGITGETDAPLDYNRYCSIRCIRAEEARVIGGILLTAGRPLPLNRIIVYTNTGRPYHEAQR